MHNTSLSWVQNQVMKETNFTNMSCYAFCIMWFLSLYCYVTSCMFYLSWHTVYSMPYVGMTPKRKKKRKMAATLKVRAISNFNPSVMDLQYMRMHATVTTQALSRVLPRTKLFWGAPRVDSCRVFWYLLWFIPVEWTMRVSAVFCS